VRLASVPEAFRIDELAQTVYGLSGEVLMEAAGALSAREIGLSFLPELRRGRIALVCGPGNNGGDALVTARHLHGAGHRDLVVLTAAPLDKQTSLFKLQLDRAERQGIPMVDVLREPSALQELADAGLVVDGLFGIGLRAGVGAPFAAVIEAMNQVAAPKVALDAPSGLNSATGRAEGVAVRAAVTLTFGLAKPGFFVAEGPAHVGRLRVLPIGFPAAAVRATAATYFLFTERLARRHLPKRAVTSNKSDHGHLLVAAGRPGYWGSGVLTSSGAFRMGAGYVTWASHEPPYAALPEIPEVLTAALGDEDLWRRRYSAVAVGPGLGTGAATATLIERLKRLEKTPVVLDADALTACAEHDLFPLPAHWVITPHAGELARLLKATAAEIERDRFAAAAQAWEKARCHVLLKGFHSLVAFGPRCLIINAGNSALAKAGTGDVLTGMIGGLLAQGVDPLPATATAAYLHGRLADEWVRSGHDRAGLSASDLREILPRVMSHLRRSGG
jgi:NAD(P)H-hydrate epimerase